MVRDNGGGFDKVDAVLDAFFLCVLANPISMAWASNVRIFLEQFLVYFPFSQFEGSMFGTSCSYRFYEVDSGFIFLSDFSSITFLLGSLRTTCSTVANYIR